MLHFLRFPHWQWGIPWYRNPGMPDPGGMGSLKSYFFSRCCYCTELRRESRFPCGWFLWRPWQPLGGKSSQSGYCMFAETEWKQRRGKRGARKKPQVRRTLKLEAWCCPEVSGCSITAVSASKNPHSSEGVRTWRLKILWIEIWIFARIPYGKGKIISQQLFCFQK